MNELSSENPNERQIQWVEEVPSVDLDSQDHQYNTQMI